MNRTYDTPELLVVGSVANVVLGEKRDTPEEPNTQPLEESTGLDLD